MFRLVRALAMPATLSVVLSACASLDTRGLPRCSSLDRRPLNSDLWSWEASSPTARAEAGALVANYLPTPEGRPAAVKAIVEHTSAEEPRWDIGASEEEC